MDKFPDREDKNLVGILPGSKWPTSESAGSSALDDIPNHLGNEVSAPV